MKSRLAIVTGASGGIGKSIVEHLINDAFIVHGIDVCSQPEDIGSAYFHHQMDIRDFSGLSKKIEAVLTPSSDYVLVNCAGLREICSIGSLTLSLWEEIFAVNVTATFVAAQAFCRKVANFGHPGAVINIASVSGLLGEPNRTAYVSSKHAVLGLTKQLAIEYGKRQIRVNAIAPGVIRTPLTEAYFHDSGQMRKIDAGQFIEQYGTPADVANAVRFLASDQSRFMTGSTLVIDGGWSAGKAL
jgi:NAD(P)-dependent dehydrogenase (short-subunit alcohol dehydrogenase family)